MNLALGDLQLSPVTGKPVASEAVPKPDQTKVPAKVDPVAKAKPQEQVLKSTKKLTVESTDMSYSCLLYTSPSPRDRQKSRMPSSA